MKKKILIIDDSALMRRVISDIINECNDYEVSAIAKDGVQGFEMIVSNPTLYSAIILDINMPKMNGLELLKKLQKNKIDQTVIVVSTVAKEGAKETIEALEYGAFDFVTKPENYLDTKSDDFKERIHSMLDVATSTPESMARTQLSAGTQESSGDRSAGGTGSSPGAVSGDRSSKVGEAAAGRTTATAQAGDARLRSTEAARRAKEAVAKNAEAIRVLREMNTKRHEDEKPKTVNANEFKDVKKGSRKLVALACSTGGPKALQQVLPYLPGNLDAGVVLVQHMPKGFTGSLAQRLDELSKISVKEAAQGEVVRKGHVYIAPGGMHIRVVPQGGDYVIKLSEEAPIDGLRPCANVMYDSLKDCGYDEITCVVLTGMGADGTEGIKSLSRHRKKIYVIAQDEASSIVYGMPKAVAQSGLVNEVVPLNKIAEAITKNVGVS